MAVGIYPPSAGKIAFDGHDISDVVKRPNLRRKINMIFQDPYSSLNPQWKIRDIVAEPIRAFQLLDSKKEIRRRVEELLEKVGLSVADGGRYPHEFSGGQRQRVSIARALASEPEFLICDEPTSALDVSVQAQILNLMKDLQKEQGLTYLFISHNLAVVRYVSDQVAVMYLGRIVEVGPCDSILDDPQHPYTRMLLDALPDPAMVGRVKMPIAGEIPSPINPPSGCAFHPRCPLAFERCRKERPAMNSQGMIGVACHAISEGRAGGVWPSPEESRLNHSSR
jgi:peptide/nickel transport system ATP-binding protein